MAMGSIPDDAVVVVFDSLIKAYAEEINPEHDFSVPGRWGLRNKIISKRKDSDAWQELRRHEVYSAVSELREMIRKTDFKVLLKDEKNLTQRDINAMENWIISVAGRDVANIVWVEWLEKNPKMNKIITDAKEKAGAAAGAAAAAASRAEAEAASRAEAEAASRAAAAEAAADDERLGVRTLDECKQTLARFKEENARLVNRLAEFTGAAVEGGARKRSRKNRRRRSKRTRRH